MNTPADDVAVETQTEEPAMTFDSFKADLVASCDRFIAAIEAYRAELWALGQKADATDLDQEILAAVVAVEIAKTQRRMTEILSS